MPSLADMVAGFYDAATKAPDKAPPLIKTALNTEWRGPVDGVRAYPPEAFPFRSRIDGRPAIEMEITIDAGIPETGQTRRNQRERQNWHFERRKSGKYVRVRSRNYPRFAKA